MEQAVCPWGGPGTGPKRQFLWHNDSQAEPQHHIPNDTRQDANDAVVVQRSDGKNPQASLAQDADGNFYGTAFAGGTASNGTVFRLDGPPPAPTNLSAVAGDGYAQLTWTASANATGYNIYRSTTR